MCSFELPGREHASLEGNFQYSLFEIRSGDYVQAKGAMNGRKGPMTRYGVAAVTDRTRLCTLPPLVR